jgi:hypothetical protein
METQTEESTSKSVRGRKDQGIEAVPKNVPETKIADLVHLHNKKSQANESYNDAVKATAEKYGLLSSVVNKKVSARAGEKYEEEKKKVEQLALVFGVESEDEEAE